MRQLWPMDVCLKGCVQATLAYEFSAIPLSQMYSNSLKFILALVARFYELFHKRLDELFEALWVHSLPSSSLDIYALSNMTLFSCLVP